MERKIADLIQKHRDSLTPRQVVFADYVAAHTTQVAFYSVAELAQKASVSQTTIVRFCHKIGYKGYAEFVNEMRQAVQLQLSAFNRYKMAKSIADDDRRKRHESFFRKQLREEIHNVSGLLEAIDEQAYEQCLAAMLAADRFCVISAIASGPIGLHLKQLLVRINHHTDFIGHDRLSAFSNLEKLTPATVVFLIAFPRYASDTVEFGRLAREKGARLVAITNSPLSPLVPLAEITFHIPVSVAAFVDGYSSVVAFITALCADYYHRLPRKASDELQKFDRFAQYTKTHTTR